ncbi:hypothetical protein N0V90_001586 [Kalmusia sp. IMI 367209]|nr:hypothetical protein N0V90_001586 [Kalmusia sp. IMI 367209]
MTSLSTTVKISPATQRLMDLWRTYTVGGSTPLPVFISETNGSYLWDVDGKRYIDFICMAGAVNQGHGNPKILEAVTQQLVKAALVNHCTNNAIWPTFAQMMCQRFGYDRIASAVSGTDGVDVACKIAQKWAITKKGVRPEKLLVLGVSDCFHADEVRMGVCRTGKFLSSDYLGEHRKSALVVLGTKDVMSVVGPREIVQTYAFSPIAIAATTAVLQIADEENLEAKAARLGSLFTERAQEEGWNKLPFVNYVTARGAEFGIWFYSDSLDAARAVGLLCMQNGLLLFPKDLHLRMSAPPIMPEAIFQSALKILGDALAQVASAQKYKTSKSMTRIYEIRSAL